MTEILLLALAPWQEALATAWLVFLRIGAVMALLPAFGERSIPLRVRLVLTIALTVLVAPAVTIGGPGPILEVSNWIGFAVAEIIAGLAVGIALRLMILVLQIAGTIAANVTSLSQILGGASVDPQPAMAHFLVVGGLALATMAGLHVKVVGAMLLSYRIFPPGQIIPAVELSEWGVQQTSEAFALAFVLSAPFVIVSVLYNLALGVINRAMPQLMVAFVGAPAITAGGLILMALAVPALLAIWLSAFDRMLWTLGAG